LHQSAVLRLQVSNGGCEQFVALRVLDVTKHLKLFRKHTKKHKLTFSLFNRGIGLTCLVLITFGVLKMKYLTDSVHGMEVYEPK